jgi:thiamine biosynthesis protein ThiS
MSITVNKKEVEFVKNETVEKLLKRTKYTFPLVIVKINNNIIPRSKYSDTTISDNSKIDVIHMISGG